MKFHAKLYLTVVPVEGIIVDVVIVGIAMLVRHVMNLTNSLKYEIGKKSDAGGRRCKSANFTECLKRSSKLSL